MTFFALLTKELRLRMRRERTIWVIIVYILLMGLLGWLSINHYNTISGGYNSSGLSNIGLSLYYLLSQLQLLLIIFITPAFTATAVNGEKERQTFDLLLCSRLSALSLVTGKLLAGLMNALLLIAASAPLFSLVFFFGGVSPVQVLKALLVFVITAIFVGTFAMFCSTLLQRPAVSTAIAYMLCLLWIGTPLIISFIMFSSSAASGGVWVGGTGVASRTFATSTQPTIMFMWNPVTALADTYPATSISYYSFGFNPLLALTAGFAPSANGTSIGTYFIAGMKLTPWLSYTLVSTLATILFFVLSIWTIKPNTLNRLQPLLRKEKKEALPEEAPVTAVSGTQSS